MIPGPTRKAIKIAVDAAAAALEGDHPLARALQRLGPARLESTVLRSKRPFVVWTSARYEAADEVGRKLLEHFGVEHDLSASLEERLRDRFLTGSDAGVDLGPVDRRAIGRRTGRLECGDSLDDVRIAAEDLDDDVGVEENAGQLLLLRFRRVSRRRRLTYASVPPRSASQPPGPRFPGIALSTHNSRVATVATPWEFRTLASAATPSPSVDKALVLCQLLNLV